MWSKIPSTFINYHQQESITINFCKLPGQLARPERDCKSISHNSDVKMSAMASQATSLMIVYSTIYSGADQRKHQIRKSKGYVYSIWVYKVLGIWKGYYRVKNHKFHAWNCEPSQEIIINIWNTTSKLHTLVLKCEPKSGLSCRRQVVHPRTQTPQGESVAKHETPQLIILSIACKYEVQGNLFSPLFEKQNPWTKTS